MVTCIQIAMAYAVQSWAWWQILLASWAISGTLNQNLFSSQHEVGAGRGRGGDSSARTRACELARAEGWRGGQEGSCRGFGDGRGWGSSARRLPAPVQGCAGLLSSVAGGLGEQVGAGGANGLCLGGC